jgi:hypothetical protein
MKYNMKLLLLSALSGIGILCSGCQEKSEEAGGGYAPEEAAENDGSNAPEEAVVADLSDNLDLEVVLALFGESESLEDFEKKLNEPERQISNLDLNGDGEVDYLRVVESSMDQTYLITVQAVLGDDLYQDVATFDVERDGEEQGQVQVVGDPYIYGTNYIIRPTYVRPPLIFAWFWGTSYRAWNSPYSWGRYPSYYRSWNPYPPYDYRNRVSRHRNSNYTYSYTTGNRSRNSATLYSKSRRNDYGSKHSGKSFDQRNKGVKNRSELTKKRGEIKVKPPGKPSQLPSVKPPGKPSQLPSAKPPGKPAKKPSAKSPGKPAKKPKK